MKRKIIRIDEERCNGCGLCVNGCPEGALQIIGGKAKLVKDQYCDGLGACLGECPEGALTIEERDADEYDEAAVRKHLEQSRVAEAAVNHAAPAKTECGCPGAKMMVLSDPVASENACGGADAGPAKFELRQWPVQLTLVPPDAPYFQGADLLLAADCAPFCVPDFHRRFLKGKAAAVGCPKLNDAEFYINKLTKILIASDIKSITVAHIEVPCCSGLIHIATEAVKASGKNVPVTEVTIGIRGAVGDTKPVKT